jgi:glycosyltransferase involved in cell wall biosynthesis
MRESLLILRFPYESAEGMGGEEKHIISLANALKEKEYLVKILTSCPCLLKVLPKSSIAYQKIWGGLDIVSKKSLIIFIFAFPLVWLNLTRHLVYNRFFYQIKNIYALTLIEKILITPVARLIGMKVFWGQHTRPGQWLTDNPFKFLFLWWSKLATVVVPSQDMRKQFIKLGIKENNIVVRPNALDKHRMPEIKHSKLGIYEKKIWHFIKNNNDKNKSLIINPGGDDEARRILQNYKIIGTVARLSPEKGINTLIQAAKKLIHFYPKCLFMVVGAGKDQDKIIAMICQEKLERNFFLLGYRSEEFIAYFLNIIDIFVLPSAYESFGISVLEALYYQKPVVVSRAGGVKDFIEHRKNGLLFTINDSTDLAKSIEYLLQHPEEAVNMGRQGGIIVREKYGMEKIIADWVKLFN